jgi:fatty-acyl-CoA synthase
VEGGNVATTEVERAIGAVEGVAQVSVYGVAVAHSDGRAGMAAVVMQPGVAFDGAAMALQLHQALPGYAVPLFVRVVKTQETTGTFKLRKVKLKQQGFDPTAISEPLFALLERDRGYKALTTEIYRRIVSGKAKL